MRGNEGGLLMCADTWGGGGKGRVCRQELEGVHLFVVMDSSNLLD